MNSEPIYDGRKREYKLAIDPNDLETLTALKELPGARVDATAKCVLGSLDAIAAAAFRLNRPLPKPAGQRQAWRISDDTMRPYQLRGIEEMLAKLEYSPGVLLADDVGLGKTRQAVVAAKLLGGRTFVVCPASVRETWRAELNRVAPNTKISILGPPSEKKYRDEWHAAKDSDYVITSYELATSAFDIAFEALLPRVMIVDEAHLLCGRESKRANKINEIAAMCDKRIGMTATPLWSRPRDLWKLFQIIVGGATLGTAYNFDMAYCGGMPGEYGGIENSGITRADELRLRIGYYTVRRTKAEVLPELPPLARQVHWVDPDPKAHGALIKALVDGGNGATANALIAALEGKMATTVELCVNAPEKRFLCATWLKDHAHELGKRIEAAGVPCLVITGDMSHRGRQQIIDSAKLMKCGIVATIDSIGVGVDGLQHVASYGVAHAIDYVPLKMVQLEGRLDRLGQKSPVLWNYVAMRESMDERVIKTCVDKLDQFRETMKPGTTEKERKLRDTFDDTFDDPKVHERALLALYEAL